LNSSNVISGRIVNSLHGVPYLKKLWLVTRTSSEFWRNCSIEENLHSGRKTSLRITTQL